MSILDSLLKFMRLLGTILEQMLLDQSLRCLAKPLEETEILELIGTEDFQYLDFFFVGQVLDKVTHVTGDDADVAGLVVKGARCTLGGEDGDAGAAFDEEGPFVCVGCGIVSMLDIECRGLGVLTMPVHLSDRTRLNSKVASSHGLGDGEVGAVRDPDLSARGVERLLSQHLVSELQLALLVALAAAWDFLLNGVWVASLENVLLFLGNCTEDFRRNAEVLCQNALGSQTHPVGKQEGRVLGEVAVVKDEEEFCAIGRKTLERVRVARGEVPEVALLKVVYKATALGVECSDADLAFEHVGPFGLLVPMEFTNDAFLEAHVDTSKLLGSTELTNGGFTGPAAFFNADVRVCKGPAHVGNGAMVSGWRSHKIWILAFSVPVARTHHACAVTIALGND